MQMAFYKFLCWALARTEFTSQRQSASRTLSRSLPTVLPESANFTSNVAGSIEVWLTCRSSCPFGVRIEQYHGLADSSGIGPWRGPVESDPLELRMQSQQSVLCDTSLKRAAIKQATGTLVTRDSNALDYVT